MDYGEAIEVEAVCTPVQLGRLKDYIVSGWTPPKEPGRTERRRKRRDTPSALRGGSMLAI